MDLHIKQQIVLMVRALYFCMIEEWETAGRAYGLSTAQQHLLFLLMTAEEPLTLSEISQRGCWHTSTVTRLVQPLQTKGLITVCAHPRYSKCKQVSLTKQGHSVFGQFIRSIEADGTFPSDLTMLTKEESLQFLHVGHKLVEARKGSPFMEWLREAKLTGVDYTRELESS